MTMTDTALFRAVVQRRSDRGRYVLIDIHNVTEDRPFRFHVWIIWDSKNIRPGQTVEFEAQIYLYKKKNGNYRFGLRNPNLIRVINQNWL